jgi:hypothetical protein
MDLYDMQKVQNNQYDGDHDQSMDPTSSARKPWADIRTQETEQPQNDKNYDDSPQHEISPFLIDRLDASRSGDRSAVDLAAQQDEDASRDGNDCQDHPKTTQSRD